MNSSSSDRRLEKFFTGKGFYIVLFLCAAVIGVSAWMMTAGNGTVSENNDIIGSFPVARTETVIIPASTVDDEASPVMDMDELLPDETEEVLEETEEETVEVFTEISEYTDPTFVWPVNGDIERAHHTTQLRYDATMCDWRTHNGIDIKAPVGSTVCASRSGFVESITKDDLYGTVITVDHGDGMKSVYANLSDVTAVSVNDTVQTGAVLGSVGDTAICESAQNSHLHFAMSVNGESVDPLNFLEA
ncbi:MAG: M23 family metallopeptidase [Eubacteriales bacterium]|nr:M23 family metallopeptidase [Eubacteriales bacterium]